MEIKNNTGFKSRFCFSEIKCMFPEPAYTNVFTYTDNSSFPKSYEKLLIFNNNIIFINY